MIDHEETGSVATEARKLAGHRMNGGLEGTCAVIRVRHASNGHGCASVGERWKASMTGACIPGLYAATQMMQAAWHARVVVGSTGPLVTADSTVRERDE